MKRQRVRYSKLPDGVLESKEVYKVKVENKEEEVRLHLNENLKKYSLVRASDRGVVISGGNTKNNAVLRIQAKRELEKLGIEFLEETRNKKR